MKSVPQLRFRRATALLMLSLTCVAYIWLFTAHPTLFNPEFHYWLISNPPDPEWQLWTVPATVLALPLNIALQLTVAIGQTRQLTSRYRADPQLACDQSAPELLVNLFAWRRAAEDFETQRLDYLHKLLKQPHTVSGIRRRYITDCYILAAGCILDAIEHAITPFPPR